MKNNDSQFIWREYQKYIADDHYYYVRSCIRQNFFPGAEQAFIKILANDLGKDLYTDPEHTTCTGIGYHVDLVKMETTMTVIARQFALMTQAGYRNLLVSCVTSFGLYNEILEIWENHPEIEEKIRDYLYKATGMVFEKPENLVHSSDVLHKYKDQLAAIIPYRLINRNTGEPLHIIDHIGCHYAKIFPEKGIGGAENPCVLSGIVDAFGGKPVDYPERRMCCGFGFRQYFLKSSRGYSLSCGYKKFKAMEPYKPDLIITNCPGCNYFFDRWQYVISETKGETYGEKGNGIPVLSSEEITALCLGYDPWEIGLQMHQTAVEPLLVKMGVEYNPADKYKGYSGRQLEKPGIPELLKVY
ncbi:MAG: heterodisulfide reductase subunit B [Bacteroidales bacterium]|nr:heterodisulfide reductase subunit B [Bacteroidales bacterium]